jgi:hypothetical protein
MHGPQLACFVPAALSDPTSLFFGKAFGESPFSLLSTKASFDFQTNSRWNGCPLCCKDLFPFPKFPIYSPRAITSGGKNRQARAKPVRASPAGAIGPSWIFQALQTHPFPLPYWQETGFLVPHLDSPQFQKRGNIRVSWIPKKITYLDSCRACLSVVGHDLRHDCI